ncbi:MAG: TlpA family protein disulfide reductase [Chloroflexota bacterium]
MTYPETTPAPTTGKRRNLTVVLSIVAVAVLLGLMALALLSPGGGRPAIGDPAPNFELTLLDGSKLRLSDLEGQVVVLNFWSSWCTPCRQEAPELQKVWETVQGQGAIFLGISYKDAEDASRAFVQELGITYPNGTDLRGRIGNTYGVTGVPETFIIDGSGRLAHFYWGEVQASELSQRLATILGQ